MAKNKNRKQGAPQDRASAVVRGTDQAKDSAFESHAHQHSHAQGSPADIARKHQRRFGHN
ncbi:hypothetical protein ACWDZ4_00080 [Streptomyces sp. NPDC003016]